MTGLIQTRVLAKTMDRCVTRLLLVPKFSWLMGLVNLSGLFGSVTGFGLLVLRQGKAHPIVFRALSLGEVRMFSLESLSMVAGLGVWLPLTNTPSGFKTNNDGFQPQTSKPETNS